MSICEGLPSGPCSYQKKGGNVNLAQGSFCEAQMFTRNSAASNDNTSSETIIAPQDLSPEGCAPETLVMSSRNQSDIIWSANGHFHLTLIFNTFGNTL